MERNATIEIQENVEVEVFFDYQPEEKETRDSPRYGPEIEIHNVYYEGVDILPTISDTEHEKIKEKLYKLE